MALSKIQSESMNLADTYAFTGTVSGTNDTKTYIPLLNVDTISGASSYHVDNTYINDTYDYYFVSGFLKAAADGKILYQNYIFQHHKIMELRLKVALHQTLGSMHK